MKKHLFSIILALALVVPSTSYASGLTSAQIQSILTLLSVFGADSATISSVTVALNGGTPSTTSQTYCHTFNSDLTVGSSGDDVSALNTALTSSGIDTTSDSSVFTEKNADDVVVFQAKYGIRQTGYVGPITRAKLNMLYGCYSDQKTTERTVAPSSADPKLVLTVNAGLDRVITLPTNSVVPESVSVGSPEGGTVTYKWTLRERDMGTALPTITNDTTLSPTFSGLTTAGEYSTTGEYTFLLTATDQSGQVVSDTMRVTVKPVARSAPIANAGLDRTITLPTNSIMPLNASVTNAESTTVTYKWTLRERDVGTPVPVITDSTTLAPTFSSLVAGSYTFRLTATDNYGLTSTDNMMVKVNPQ